MLWMNKPAALAQEIDDLKVTFITCISSKQARLDLVINIAEFDNPWI